MERLPPKHPTADVAARALVLEGSVGIITVDALLASARAALDSGQDIALDASAVERFDSAALQVLVALRRELTSLGRSLRWSACSVPARECIELAGLRNELALGNEAATHAAAERST